jgi:hypothetical protein
LDRVHRCHDGNVLAAHAAPRRRQHPAHHKAVNITMCTIGHWNGDTMDEEHLFWDQKTFMDQLGLGQK